MATQAQRLKWVEEERQHLAAHRVVTADGREVRKGDVLPASRGEVFTFLYLTRAPGDGSATQGKILVRPVAGGGDREYYPQVFGLRVERIAGASSPWDAS